ncbi:MAG: response regulator [bacterium]
MTTTVKEKRDILVVDDEDNIRNSLFDILSEEGYNVKAVDGSTSALKEIEIKEPHVIITDIRMSTSKDGLKLLQHVKNNYPDIKTIIMTGYGEAESYLDAKIKGAYGYLVKPFNILVLKRMVADALKSTYDN